MHHKVSGICLVRLKRSLKVAVGLSLHLALGRESKAGSLLPRPASPLRRSPASVTVALAKATTEESAVRPGYQSGCVPRPRIDKGVAELLRPSLPLPLPTYHSPSLSLSLLCLSLSLSGPSRRRPTSRAHVTSSSEPLAQFTQFNCQRSTSSKHPSPFTAVWQSILLVRTPANRRLQRVKRSLLLLTRCSCLGAAGRSAHSRYGPLRTRHPSEVEAPALMLVRLAQEGPAKQFTQLPALRFKVIACGPLLLDTIATWPLTRTNVPSWARPKGMRRIST